MRFDPPLRRDGIDVPRHDRLAPDNPDRDAILACHAAALAAGHAGYLDPVTGLFVFTAAALAARRRCCDTGCRHCPYEPRRWYERVADHEIGVP